VVWNTLGLNADIGLWVEGLARAGLNLSFCLLGMALLIPRWPASESNARIVRLKPLRKLMWLSKPGLFVLGAVSLIWLLMILKSSRGWAPPGALSTLQLAALFYLSMLGVAMVRWPGGESGVGRMVSPEDSEPVFEYGQRTYTYRRVAWITALCALASTSGLSILGQLGMLRSLGTFAGGESYFMLQKAISVFQSAALCFLSWKLLWWKRRVSNETQRRRLFELTPP
jgi:hypothetical protein